MARLAGVQRKLSTAAHGGLIKLEKKLRKELLEVLEQEHLLWFQKSRSRFLIDGDRNTKFFHISTLVRRQGNQVMALKDNNGVWVGDQRTLAEMASNFFY